ncbi:hypothetical protein FHR24_003076 [Wenyingzhuangia heitensis]|uniref:Lipoprotein n=1 Tax=Wenyingzhuangia heitensis TaxID=1487859 RepID=A0ABX0UGS3_9FLAO|nr:hypothetical protein [Wenyingzhuangia heitensis]NIJ46586.1 hypothetical protein [Wenyingzhuangia heitensis]
MKRKMILGIVLMTMLVTGCSKDDSDSIENEKITDVITSEKSKFKFVFTQTGEVENYTGILAVSGLSDNVYDVNTLEIINGKEINLGRTAFVNVHEREVGSYTFVTANKTKSLHVVITTSGYSLTDVGVRYNFTVYKNDKEIFNQDFDVVKGSGPATKSYVF